MPETTNDRIQLHIEIDSNQHRQFQLALRKLGYRTISEYIREQVRRVIAEASAK